MRDIFGSRGFQLYADVPPILSSLKRRGLRMAIVSNWPHGLTSFCHEMEVASFFNAIVSSAELRIEKPDARIFDEAIRLLDVNPHRTIHVGDTMDEDIAGAVSAGLQAIWIDRNNTGEPIKNRITSLYDLEALLFTEAAQQAQ
jgi:putative hydrolase of the HAD superfamily